MDASKYKKGDYVDYRDLSDIDFIRNLDLLASHYHSDYMQGRGMLTGNVDSFFSRTQKEDFVAPVFPKYPPRTVSFTGYYVRRTFCLFMVFLLSLLELVYVAISWFDISFVKDNLYMFGNKVMFFDALEGALSLESPLSSLFSDQAIWGYVVAGLSVLYVLMSLATLILSLCALCAKRRPDGTYKKFRFGGLALVRLACALVTILAAFLCKLTPVYIGSIVVAVAPLLVLDFSLLSYKKRTITVPETALDAYGKVKIDTLRNYF